MYVHNHWKKEIEYPGELFQNVHGKNAEVKRLQEWLNLTYRRLFKNGEISMDGHYGPITSKVVNELKPILLDLPPEKLNNPSGQEAINKLFWNLLITPMAYAFQPTFAREYLDPSYQKELKKDHEDWIPSLREALVRVAEHHLFYQPSEFRQNRGPWVRAYMNGHDGPEFPWCCGFVHTLLDMAYSLFRTDYSKLIKPTWSCDNFMEDAKEKGYFINQLDLASGKAKPIAGDVFLVLNPNNNLDARHTGIVTEVCEEPGLFQTVEGNTNNEGHREGTEVCWRYRNYLSRPIAFIRLPEPDMQ